MQRSSVSLMGLQLYSQGISGGCREGDVGRLWWCQNNQFVRDGVLSNRVLGVAGVVSGILAIYRLDQQRSVGEDAHAIVGTEFDALDLPCDLGLGGSRYQVYATGFNK